VVDAKDTCQVAQAVALYPVGFAAALQALDHRAGGAVQAEALVELGGDLGGFVLAE
jgi:hypothetical protein